MVTSTGTRLAMERAQIHKFIDHCANQVHAQNVHGRMFNSFLVVCRRFPGRTRELFAKWKFCQELTTKWLWSRGMTGIVMTVLSLVTLAHRTGVPVQPLDSLAPFGLIRTWKAAEHKIIRLKNRAREDYQSLQLIYQVARRIRNLQEQQEICEQRTTLPSGRCSPHGTRRSCQEQRSLLGHAGSDSEPAALLIFVWRKDLESDLTFLATVS